MPQCDARAKPHLRTVPADTLWVKRLVQQSHWKTYFYDEPLPTSWEPEALEQWKHELSPDAWQHLKASWRSARSRQKSRLERTMRSACLRAGITLPELQKITDLAADYVSDPDWGLFLAAAIEKGNSADAVLAYLKLNDQGTPWEILRRVALGQPLERGNPDA